MKNTFFLALAALILTASAQAQSTVDSISAKYKLLPMPEALTVEKIFPVLGTYTLNTDLNANQQAQTTTQTQVTTATEQPADSATTAVTANDATPLPSVVITLDSASKGVVWVEGLPEGKFKAYLKQSPATYRIVAQKTESGTQIPEGTLIFDTTAKVLNIALGVPFNETEPAAVFMTTATATTDSMNADEAEATTKAKAKTKGAKTKAKPKKVTYYTATKVVPVPAQTETAPAQEQNQQQTTDQQSNGQNNQEQKEEEQQ